MQGESEDGVLEFVSGRRTQNSQPEVNSFGRLLAGTLGASADRCYRTL